MAIDEQEERIVVRERSLIDGKTVVIGGGIAALIWLIFFRGGGGGKDKGRLLFKFRPDGLWLGNQLFHSVTDAVVRIRAGGRDDVELLITGDVPQGQVEALEEAFRAAGVTVFRMQPKSIASIYQKGRGGLA